MDIFDRIQIYYNILELLSSSIISLAKCLHLFRHSNQLHYQRRIRAILPQTHASKLQKPYKNGLNVAFACHAFGCGSSRENAVSPLPEAVVICVIAKSFAFVYTRNQLNSGLLGIAITKVNFYEAAVDGASIDIDLERFKVRIRERE